MSVEQIAALAERIADGAGAYKLDTTDTVILESYQASIVRPSWRGPPNYPPIIPLPPSPYRSRYSDLTHDEFWALPIQVRSKYFAGPSMLEDLPLELREMIFEFAMAHLPDILVVAENMRAGQFFYPKTLPGICFVKRTFFQEGLMVYLRRQRYEIGGKSCSFAATEVNELEDAELGPMPSFISAIDSTEQKKGWLWVRDVTFTSDINGWSPSDHQFIMEPYTCSGLVLRAPALHRLTLNFRSSLFCKYNLATHSFQSKSAETMVERFHIQSILWLASLRTLVLRFHTAPTEREVLGVFNLQPQDFLQPFLQWLRDGFSEWNRRVMIHVQMVDDDDT
ncbi:hypothetical protein BDV96DRAFT_606877 [Lophiotrema nucula]|uniref:Uncharacterized protein n=1 Tax=Lophiotrema nucula TaxID=690887 RepID=A0A6A5YLJ1_9PLEO|nr:hypothetical protein BDV96DRAFT_606877 [Lophiotrema nucula]